MAVEAFDTVLMLVTGHVLFVTDADLLAVARLALACDRAGSTWIQLLLQIASILALGDLHAFGNL